jgi:hypothetical protein
MAAACSHPRVQLAAARASSSLLVGSLTRVSRQPRRRGSSGEDGRLGRWPQTFTATLVTVVATRVIQRLVRGTRHGSAPHLHVVRVLGTVPAEISNLLLGSGGRQHWVMSIFLIEEVILGFF